MKYVALISDRADYYHRYWEIRNSLEEIKELAREYECNNRFVQIYTISSDFYNKLSGIK